MAKIPHTYSDVLVARRAKPRAAPDRDQQQQVGDHRHAAGEVEDVVGGAQTARTGRSAATAGTARWPPHWLWILHHRQRIADGVPQPRRVRRQAHQPGRPRAARSRPSSAATRASRARGTSAGAGDAGEPGEERERDRPAVLARDPRARTATVQRQEDALGVGEHQRERIRREHQVEQRAAGVRLARAGRGRARTSRPSPISAAPFETAIAVIASPVGITSRHSHISAGNSGKNATERPWLVAVVADA